MPKKATHVVCQHMEGIPAKALEQYQDIIREYIRGRHGIYALYKRDRLYYVGLASNLRSRLRHHLRDRHQGLWDKFSVFLTIEHQHIKEMESLVLRIVQPKGNRQKGKFPKSQDLKKLLTQEVRERQRQELEVLEGKRVKVVKRRSKKVRARSEKSETALGPYTDQRRFHIRAIYKGKTYHAVVRKDGWILYDGYLYRSPSAAGHAVLNRPSSGWSFWKYQRAPGDWVPLRMIKK